MINHALDPDRLDLQRYGMPQLSFGVGMHVCLGFPLARIEGQIAPLAPHRAGAARSAARVAGVDGTSRHVAHADLRRALTRAFANARQVRVKVSSLTRDKGHRAEKVISAVTPKAAPKLAPAATTRLKIAGPTT